MVDSKNPRELSSEGVALLRRQYEIDYEASGPKAPYNHQIHKGVRIESRWQVLREFEVMREAIDAMPELMGRRIAWMWCDSNCGSNFVIGVKPSLYILDLKWAIKDAFRSANGGHNGITIEDGASAFTGKVLAIIDPDWSEEF
jgi:hypothetical protein